MRPDDKPGATSLTESLAAGRKLLERQLTRTATLEDYRVSFHQSLFFDDAVALRLDIEAEGGNALRPALTVDMSMRFRLVFEEEEDSAGEWKYEVTGVVVRGRYTVDVHTPILIADQSVTVVDDSTDFEPVTDNPMYNNSFMYNGTKWDRGVYNTSTWTRIGYDNAAKRAFLGFTFQQTDMWRYMVGLSEAHRRIQEKPRLAAAARFLQDTWEEGENRQTSISIDASVDWSCSSSNTCFNANVNFNMDGKTAVALTWAMAESPADRYTHDLSLAFNMEEQVELGQFVAPTIASGNRTSVPFNPYDRVQFQVGMSLTSQIVLDVSTAQGSITMTAGGTPTCGTASYDTYAPVLAAYSPALAISGTNPQCRMCTNDRDDTMEGWWGSGGLVNSACGPRYAPQSDTYWERPRSCCMMNDLSFLDEFMNDTGMTFGSRTDSDTMRIDLGRHGDGMDIFGWLATDITLPNVSFIEDMPRLISTETISNGVTRRTWILRMSDEDLISANMTEQGNAYGGKDFVIHGSMNRTYQGGLQASYQDAGGRLGLAWSLQTPNGSDLSDLVSDFNVTFDRLDNGDSGFVFHSNLKTGPDNEQVSDISSALAITRDSSSDITGMDFTGTIMEEVGSNVGSAVASFTMSSTRAAMSATVKDGNDEKVVGTQFEANKDTNRMWATFQLEDSESTFLRGRGDAERQNGGVETATATLWDQENTVLASLTGTFTEMSTTGGVSASLAIGDEEEAAASGTLNKQGMFYVGDLTVALGDSSQRVWVNASNGYQAIPAKLGLAGFRRMYISLGTLIDEEEEDTQINTSMYWELPPFDDWLSAVGLTLDIDDVSAGNMRDIADTTLDVEFPYTRTNSGSGGQAQTTTTEVVQTLDLEITMADVSAFSADTFKTGLAAAAQVDVSKVQVERVDYKISTGYELNVQGCLSELEARRGIADANAVQLSEVAATLSAQQGCGSLGPAAGDLEGGGREAARDGAGGATITVTDQVKAVAAKASAQSTTNLVASLASTVNKSATASITSNPVTKVKVVTRVNQGTVAGNGGSPAPITSTMLSSMGNAMGGTVAVISANIGTETRTIEDNSTSTSTSTTVTPGDPDVLSAAPALTAVLPFWSAAAAAA
eukprot:CAMPEP_0168435088 /NCGR_PEP_ID=MMETSP0228-20121227/40236_1 /TAXON_ID=133427 /ORGANISM="Protoceratium reticulatum, Strain CCCM 535 (=CCMP 1889)" /LENGTH=1119 /DNA_ID=CAMNT_0008449255 /DNA_START=29 /DNA_END=3385 /DNA_ORIENTATION=-